MKNSASEVFCIDHSVAYQHAFGYIRQLAIHLRNSMKIKSKVLVSTILRYRLITRQILMLLYFPGIIQASV